MTAPIIHLIFKTHLDVGFTDHAARVRRQYHEQFIPQAIATGEHFFREDPDRPAFVWTVGAWLIWDHLETQDSARIRRLEEAIERGLMTWHALPFTTHTELMSPALFRAGLSYAQELDRRFGRRTTAAKMTDVPGHTLGMVPLLAQAGVRFLHLGVNTASPVPDVPPIFRWRAPDGSEVVVMYQGSYGATDFPAGPDVGISFAHTADNIGPQSVPQTVEVLRQLQHACPDATIVSSTLDAFGAEMWARRETLPVVTDEIGDSWIHGAASDPIKLARFRALQRLYNDWDGALTTSRLAFGRNLAMVAEHTWGVDIKSFLRDDRAWHRPAFEAARRSDYRFAYTEQSWAEQRAYIDTALAAIDGADRVEADARMAELGVSAPATPLPGTGLEHGGWSAEVDPQTGDLASLSMPDGTVIDGRGGSLIGYRHESYDWQALQQHLDTYLQHREDWAILDHDKPGLENARSARRATIAPEFAGIAEGACSVAILPREANAVGAPLRAEIAIHGIGPTELDVSLMLRDKPANRMPEAGFLHVTPKDPGNWELLKLGIWHRTDAIVRRGGAQLQAVDAVRSGSLTIELLDAALVAPADAAFMPYQPELPDFSNGIRVNLYNNKWGTNFPMWWEGTVRFRFRLRFAPTQDERSLA